MGVRRFDGDLRRSGRRFGGEHRLESDRCLGVRLLGVGFRPFVRGRRLCGRISALAGGIRWILVRSVRLDGALPNRPR